MSFSRSSANQEADRSRDPRHRDRSRSEIRRPNSTETPPTPIVNRPEQSTPTNSVVDFFKTLGLNSQLIQALINANPPKPEQIQPQPPLINNAQEFASFLSKNYGLDSTTITPSSNQPVNRDPRRRPIPIGPSPASSISTSSTVDPRSTSINDSYKQFLCSIDQTLFDDETRRRFQRIALLDDELEKLHRIHIELTKTTERHSRRRTSTKAKDPLLKENENLQHELIDSIQTLKTSIMNSYSTSIYTNHMIIARQ